MLEFTKTSNHEVPGDARPGLRIVMVYEDIAAGKHARRTYDYLSDNLGSESALHQSMWKFDLLAIAKLREIAARDAAEADLVVVSSHGGKELPPAARDWLETFLAQKSKPLALVALFDCQESAAEGVRKQLAVAARRAGIEFFAQRGRVDSNTRVKEAFQAPVVQPASWPSSSPEILIPRWGINE